MSYKGETQEGQHACVFASVVGAVNWVAKRPLWTQTSLFDEWCKKGIQQVNFANIYPIAIQPAKSHVKVRHFEDGRTPISNSDYLKMINECVDEGGIAIVSLQLGHLEGSKLVLEEGWHMLSLSSRKGTDFEAWDTADGKMRTVTTDQLISYIPYGNRVLAVHERHDLLLVQPI
jgi:hypothetical protein